MCAHTPCGLLVLSRHGPIGSGKVPHMRLCARKPSGYETSNNSNNTVNAASHSRTISANPSTSTSRAKTRCSGQLQTASPGSRVSVAHCSAPSRVQKKKKRWSSVTHHATSSARLPGFNDTFCLETCRSADWVPDADTQYVASGEKRNNLPIENMPSTSSNTPHRRGNTHHTAMRNYLCDVGDHDR